MNMYDYEVRDILQKYEYKNPRKLDEEIGTRVPRGSIQIHKKSKSDEFTKEDGFMVNYETTGPGSLELWTSTPCAFSKTEAGYYIKDSSSSPDDDKYVQYVCDEVALPPEPGVLNYVTSAPEDKYPKNGMYNGKWYIRLDITNRPPIISGKDSDLGVKTTGFDISFSVTDADVIDPLTSDSVSIEVRLDKEVIMNQGIEVSKDYIISIKDELWLKLQNGNHTITINAKDTKGGEDIRIFTFKKNVNTTTVTLSKPLISEEMPTRALLMLNGYFTDESKLEVLVCNNALDEKPTWEVVTKQVLTGTKIFFNNQIKTSEKWAYNFQVKLSKNDSSESVFISKITGNFE